MNVLFVTHNFPPHNWGGVETYSLNMAKALQARGASVSVLYPATGQAGEPCRLLQGSFEGIPTRRLIAPPSGLASSLADPEVERCFEQLLAEIRPDLVHFQHTLHFPLSLVRVARTAGFPVVLTLHDFWSICLQTHLFVAEGVPACRGPEAAEKCAACLLGSDWYGVEAVKRAAYLEFLQLRLQAGRAAVAAADLVTAPSAFVAETYGRAGAGAGRIEVVPLGLPPPGAVPVRAPRPLTFGYLGSIHGVKNVHALVEAFTEVVGDVRLIIAGGGPPEQLERLEVLATDPRIELRGPYLPADLSTLLADFDVVVVPSVVESYCFTAREALAAGIPVIASRVGGLPEAVVHGVNGLLFDPFAAGALRELLQSVADDRGRLQSLRAAPVAPTIEADATGWLARYQSLTARPTVPPAAPADPARPRVAYLHELHWMGGEWRSVLADYLRCFRADRPVALLLVVSARAADGPSLEEVEAAVTEAAMGTGGAAIPEVLLIEPKELVAQLRPYTRVEWVAAAGGPGGRFPAPPGGPTYRGVRVNRAGSAGP